MTVLCEVKHNFNNHQLLLVRYDINDSDVPTQNIFWYDTNLGTTCTANLGTIESNIANIGSQYKPSAICTRQDG